MTPNQFPDLYASIVLGTARSPGVVTLTGHDREWSWDVQQAKGQTGASSALNGDSVGQFQASFYLASPADQIAWPAFQRVLESAVMGPKPVALPIYHPDLAANRFTEVCVATIGGVVRGIFLRGNALHEPRAGVVADRREYLGRRRDP